VDIYRHTDQRPLHLVRYGPLHLWRHVRSVQHGHRRAIVAPEDRFRNWVIYTLLGAAVVVGVLVVMGIVSFLSIHRAENDLSAAKTLIGNDLGNKSLLTTANGRIELSNDIATVQKDAAEATSSLTGSVSLGLLGHLPVIGTQRTGVIQLAQDVETAANDAAALLNAINNLVDNSHGTSVSLTALGALHVYVDEGLKQLSSIKRPDTGLIGPLASARRSFNAEDVKLIRLLRLSSKTIDFALPFLGANGPQTYLIAGQNNAEMRDGGAVLSLDLLTAADGTFTVGHDSTYGNYALSSPAQATLPAGTEQVFGAYQPTLNWPNTDATADWPASGLAMQAMWLQATGQKVDGVIGMDVPGVARILRLTGPVTVPNLNVAVSETNIGNLLLNQAYQGLTVNDSQAGRRELIASVVKAAINKMKTEHVDLDAFANALAYDVSGRHLMVWSDVPKDEAGLVAVNAAGTLDATLPGRSIHVAVENSTADKLDYLVAVSMAVKVTVDPQGGALVNTTVKVFNFAQVGHAPSYQYGPDGVNAFTPGQYGARIFYWGPTGAQVPGAVSESGLQLAQSHFSLLPGQRNQVTFSTYIPHAVVNGQLQLRLIPQARLIPDRLKIQLSAPGWSVQGSRSTSTHLVGTTIFHWGMTR
jgi:hypothetical protein